jgi:hypothetical protein
VFGRQLPAASLLDDVCEFVREESTLTIRRERSGAGKVNVTLMGKGIRLEIPSPLAYCFSANDRGCCGGHPGGCRDRCSDVGGNRDRCWRPCRGSVWLIELRLL